MPHDPAPSDEYLTPAEAASLLEISVATLRRWASVGLVPSERTPGGHRRFRRADLRRIVPRARTDDPGPRWADLMLAPAGTLALEAALHRARSQLGSWWAVTDEFFPGVLELYRRTEDGAITLLQQLAAFEQLGRALCRFLDLAPSDPGAPELLVAGVPGDRLLHPLRGACLCAGESGWRTRWAGLATADEIRTDLARARPDALVVSASMRTESSILAGQLPSYRTLAVEAGLPTFLLGAWPDDDTPGLQAGGPRQLAAWLSAHRPGHGRPGPSREGATA